MRLRIKKLVKHDLQLKMVGVFLGLACICGFFQLLLVNRSLIGLLKDTRLDDPAILSRLPGILTSNFLITLAVLVPLMGYVGILMTQRIAGPVYRFEKYLDGLLAGEESRLCTIRKGDELQDLCDKINAVAGRYLEQNPRVVDEDSSSAAGLNDSKSAEQAAA